MKSPELYQPIFSRKPEPGHTEPALTFEKFLELFREEENYYPGEQNNTKLMMTRLRKIYYDSWGWSSQVIRKAAKIPGRYHTEMVPVENQPIKKTRLHRHNSHFQLIPITYKVTYTAQDHIYPERAGQTPEIYAHDNQELITPQGFFCDIGHVLSGIDAYNNSAPISPLPDFLLFLRFLFPKVDSNMDFATWLGDIASTAGDFLLEKLSKKYINREEKQETIDKDNPGSDVIGNIDSYAIKEIFNTESNNGLKVSEILDAYYNNHEIIKKYQSRVISIFCSEIGLKGWNGRKYSNEKEWLKYYKNQLRNATAFYVYGEVGKLRGAWLALKVWLRFYEKELNLKLLLRIFLNALKEQVISEQKNLNR